MNRHKKKNSGTHNQKVEQAHQRNEFFIRLHSFIDAVGGEGIYKLIPQQHLDTIYLVRNRPVRVIAAEGHRIAPAVLKDMQEVVRGSLQTGFIPFEMGALKQLSLYDFFTVCITCVLYVNRLKETDYEGAARVKNALDKLADIEENMAYHQAWSQFGGMMNTQGLFHSDIRKEIYTLQLAIKTQINGLACPCFCMEVHVNHTEKISMAIDGSQRPLYRLGWGLAQALPGIHYITVPAEKLGLKKGRLLDVYLQAHAFERLHERIDGVEDGTLHFNLFESFTNLTVCRNRHGELLFEYRLFGKKTGYFRGDVIADKLVLRTFLFLTNNGTPEGEKLHSHTGIKKEDKMYLAIDKYSTFVASDIANNSNVKQMFIEAGCESLFELDKWVYFLPGGVKEKKISDFIARYLKLDTPSVTL